MTPPTIQDTASGAPPRALPVPTTLAGGWLLCLLLLTACTSGEEAPATTVVDSAGVALVSGPSVDTPLAWTVQEILTIRPLEVEGEGFFGITDLDVLAGNRIVVLDGDAKRVVTFDEDGAFLAQYGREGSGPGEFRWPMDLAPRPDGGVAVFDMMNRRLEQFDEFLAPEAPDAMQGINYYGGGIRYAGPWMILPTVDYSVPTPRPQAILAILEADTVEVVQWTRETGGVITLESCGMQLSGIEPIFAPRTHWASAPGERLVVGMTNGYEVDVYGQPGYVLERRIRREVPVIQATEALARATIGDAMRVMASGGERVCDADEVVEKRGFVPEIPPIAAVAVSPAGEIYLQRWAPEGEDRAIDILTPDGGYLGTLAPGFPFPDAFLGEDRIVVQERDELDLSSVVVYRIGK